MEKDTLSAFELVSKYTVRNRQLIFLGIIIGLLAIGFMSASNQISIVGYNSSNTTYINATSINGFGFASTSGNNTTLINLFDNISWSGVEAVGQPWNIYTNYTNVTQFDYIESVTKYNSTGAAPSAHEIEFYIWCVTNNEWVEIEDISVDLEYHYRAKKIVNSSHFIFSNGTVFLRYQHADNGNANHRMWIDSLRLVIDPQIRASITTINNYTNITTNGTDGCTVNCSFDNVSTNHLYKNVTEFINVDAMKFHSGNTIINSSDDNLPVYSYLTLNSFGKITTVDLSSGDTSSLSVSASEAKFRHVNGSAQEFLLSVSGISYTVDDAPIIKANTGEANFTMNTTVYNWNQTYFDMGGANLTNCANCVNNSTIISNLDLKVNKSGDTMTNRLFVNISASVPAVEINRLGVSTSEADFAMNRNSYWSYFKNTVASSTAAHSPLIFFQKSSGSIASPGSVTNGHTLGQFIWYGYNNGNWRQAALFGAKVDGTMGTTSPPTSLFFATAQGNTGAATDRMLINNSGKLFLYNLSNLSQNSALCINKTSSEITYNGDSVICGNNITSDLNMSRKNITNISRINNTGVDGITSAIFSLEDGIFNVVSTNSASGDVGQFVLNPIQFETSVSNGTETTFTQTNSSFSIKADTKTYSINSTHFDMNGAICEECFSNSSWQQVYQPYQGSAISGTWAWGAVAGQMYGGVFGSTGVGADGQEYRWNTKIPAGNYTLSFVYPTASNRGVHEVWLNTSTSSLLISSVDAYSAATTVNLVVNTNFTIPTERIGYISSKVNGRNGASTNYFQSITNLLITSRQ